MVSTCERSLNVVTDNKPKMLTGLGSAHKRWVNLTRYERQDFALLPVAMPAAIEQQRAEYG
jgi:hypothetical protein